MKKRYFFIAGILIVLAGFVAFSMSTRPIEGGKKMIEKSQPAIDFNLKNLEGDDITLSSFQGKVVFLNFWATWCPPCRGEMPSIQKLHEKMQDRDFIILAVSIGEKENAVKNFIEKNNYTFPVLLDPDNQAAQDYDISGIPTTLLVDKEGKVVFRETGSRNWASTEIIEQIEELLK